MLDVLLINVFPSCTIFLLEEYTEINGNRFWKQVYTRFWNGPITNQFNSSSHFISNKIEN
uniref:Uncharacterized protein n=1 Tax=Urocitellus parryii TaxID=9999 RepID=A0A8D2HY25_UROPR